jgi:hypothetical protein
MPFESMREKLRFTQDEIAILVAVSRSRTHPLREVERAKILLANVEGINDSQIARDLHTNRHKVIRTIRKALAYGLEDALKTYQERVIQRRFHQKRALGSYLSHV